MINKSNVFCLITIFLIGGIIFTIKGFKIEIKSKVSQILLNNAWSKSIKFGDYHKPWTSFDGAPILRLDIPKHNISQIVLKGTSAQSLAFGPSLHLESYLPNENKVTIISSHRDSHGEYIKKLKLGEIIKLQNIKGEWHHYIIDNFLILNSLKENISINQDVKKLLIITCYPFHELRSGTPYRYIVSATEYLD